MTPCSFSLHELRACNTTETVKVCVPMQYAVAFPSYFSSSETIYRQPDFKSIVMVLVTRDEVCSP